MSYMPAIFIDGEVGTTGLKIREHLVNMPNINLRVIANRERKNPLAKKVLLEEVDLVVLCLPDAAAYETVRLIDTFTTGRPKIIDTTTAHRVD